MKSVITDSKIYITIKFGTVGHTGLMLVKYGKVGLLINLNMKSTYVKKAQL